MAGVLTDHVPQQDVLIRRGVDARWCVLWEQDAGKGFSPVDMLGWASVVRLESLHGYLWLETTAECTEDGYAIITIPAASTTGKVWAGRAVGRWSVTVTDPNGAVTRLADGNLRVED